MLSDEIEKILEKDPKYRENKTDVVFREILYYCDEIERLTIEARELKRQLNDISEEK